MRLAVGAATGAMVLAMTAAVHVAGGHERGGEPPVVARETPAAPVPSLLAPTVVLEAELEVATSHGPEPERAGWIPTYHPIAVHLALGLLVGAVLFELAGAVARSDGLRAASRWNLLAGVPATAAAVLTGYAEAAREHGHGAFADEVHALLAYHQALGFAVLATVLLLAVWSLWAPARGRRWYRACLGLLALGLVIQGYLGGEMVYRYGSGVRLPMPRAEVRVIHGDELQTARPHAGGLPTGPTDSTREE